MKAIKIRNIVKELLTPMIAILCKQHPKIQSEINKLCIYLYDGKGGLANKKDPHILWSIKDMLFLHKQVLMFLPKEVLYKGNDLLGKASPSQSFVCFGLWVGLKGDEDIPFIDGFEDYLNSRNYMLMFQWGQFFTFCHELSHIYLNRVNKSDNENGCDLKEEIAADSLAFKWLNSCMDNTDLDLYKAIGVLCGLSVAFQGESYEATQSTRSHPKTKCRMSKWIESKAFPNKEKLCHAYKLLCETNSKKTNDK